MEESALTLVIWALFAYWCYKIAEKNGRDRGWAILWGLLGGLVAVIIYALIGQTAEKKIENAKKLLGKE